MSVSPPDKRGVTPGKAMIAAVSGYAMDGFDLLILGFMLPAISAALVLTSSQAGSLVTWTLIGAVLGGIIFGHLSDRLGRIRVLTFTILMFSLFTGLCAVAQGYWDLLAYRTLAGMGLGGEFGIGMALIAEAWPANKRNRASAWVGMGWQLGVLLAAFITPFLLDIIGWRGMFLVGLLPALASFAIRRGMGSRKPSPSMWMLIRGCRSRRASGCCLPMPPPPKPASASLFSARCRTSAITA